MKLMIADERRATHEQHRPSYSNVSKIAMRQITLIDFKESNPKREN
jgi:hypothetical protein